MARRRTTVSSPPSPLNWFERWRKRAGNNIRQATSRGDHTTMIMTWALLLLPVMAFHAAGEIEGVWSLAIVGFLAAGLGYFLAWSSLSEGVALLVSASYGLAIVTISQIIIVADGGTPAARISDFVTRLSTSVDQISNDTANEDTLIILLFGAVFWWFLAHNTVWHIFRIDRVWRAIIPPALIMFGYTAQYQGDAPLEVFIILYILLALLLIVRSHVDAREYEWYKQQVRYPRYMRQYFLRVGAGLAIMFVLVAWILPTGEDQENQDQLQQFWESLGRLGEIIDQLLSPVENEGISTTDYYGGDKLDLSGAISLGEQVVLEVVAPPSPTRHYWRSTAFDTYVSGSWSHNRGVRATKPDEGLRLNIGTFAPQSRESITQTVRMQLNASSLIYAAPQAVYFGLPVRVELDCVTDISNTSCVNDGQEVDVSITRAVEPIRQGDTYTIESSVSVATADMLRSAGADYPNWITSKYLQGTEQATQRLKDLSLQIISEAGATTPYDQTKAVERWLRANITYNEQIPPPPINQDPVDWVVFDHREGYCNYYASAMILMLRTLGIPSRMAAGFSQGEFDPAQNAYIVRERDAHTWVEVYFPNYGWVNFEPTADEQPLDRDGDRPPDEPQATFTPLPSPTPTEAPTMTPTSEGGQDAAQQPTPTPQQNEQQIPLTPTPTLTPTPQPTATPLPTQQETKIESDEDDLGILGVILGSFLAAIILVVLAIVIVLFLIWWVEHRGLGGLSMTEKAYARMGIYGNWLGINLPTQQTPEERRQRLIKGVPTAQEPVNEITQLYVEQRFAPPVKNEKGEEVAAEAWTKARVAFLRQKLRQWFSWK